MERQKMNFENVVREIQGNKILLPDFQRGFVWKEEDKQKKLVASVLAKMPIGSILLLEANSPDEFASKKIGKKCNVDNLERIDQSVQFLLDGQQRVTVLTNVFSNVIFENGDFDYRKELVSNKLQCRFFLKIPKNFGSSDYDDIFGSSNLDFPLSSPAEDEPNYLTNDVLNYIEIRSFGANEDCVYNPRKKTNSTSLRNYCVSNKDYPDDYLIPLYLLIDEKGGSSRYLNGIIKAIGDDILENLVYRIAALDSIREIESEIRKYLGEEYYEEFSECIHSSIEKSVDENIYINEFKSQMQEKQNTWVNSMITFLTSCITGMNMNKIVVENSNRARAIDIYENLNLGGVSLSVFDLVMARVAKVSKINFKTRIYNYLKELEVSSKNEKIIEYLLPDGILGVYKEYIDKNKKYYPVMRTRCVFNEEEFTKIFLDVFLNVLSIYSYNSDFDTKNIKIDYIKKNRILNLSPEQINDNCELVCNSINRAMFFLQVRCGIRDIKEINYNLIVVIIAYIFIDEAKFYDKSNHNLLEAWYWSCIFSGEFDKDQNSRCIEHLKNLLLTMEGKKDKSWIKNLEARIFNEKGFSDQETLLYENIEVTNRTPKEFLRRMISQYLLSNVYETPFEDDVKCVKRHSVFNEKMEEYELHHIIPLGSATDISESSKKLRKDKDNILNTPLNFIYISKEENKAISNRSLSDYVKHMNNTTKLSLHLNGELLTNTEDDVKKVLENRFDGLKADMLGHVHELINL